jgi:hypothetical protein
MTHVWEGHAIDVRFRLVPRTAWLGGGFIVRVDGQSEFRPPSKLESGGTTTAFEIQHGDRTLSGHVRSTGRVSALRTRYEVLVDGVRLGEGSTRAENWYVPYLAFAVSLIVLLGGWLWLEFGHRG